jgi:hypothetical protein
MYACVPLRTRCCASRDAARQSTAPCAAAGTALPRRTLLSAGVALLAAAAPQPRARAAAPRFLSAAGLEYYDVRVGDGEEAVAGDTVRVVYSARALDAAGAAAVCAACAAEKAGALQAPAAL